MGITISEIAKKTGFGYGTVARALSDNPLHVKEETRKKILQVAEKHGYVRDLNAQALVKGRTRDIGLLIPAVFGSSFYNDLHIKLISGIIGIMSSSPYELRLLLLKNASKFPEVARDIRSLKLAGLIYSSIFYPGFHVSAQDIKNLDIPVAVLNEHVRERNIYSVILDDFAGGYDGTSYLIKMGHRQIGIIRGTYKDIEDRFAGYKKAMLDNGIALNKDHVTQGDATEEAGYRGTLELLEKSSRPTAIFCLDDEMAIGAMRAIKDKGMRCPEDVSVLGFDGMDIGNYAIPRLTTMVRPIVDMGKIAVEILLDGDNGKKRKKKCLKVRAELLERETCKKI